MAKKNFKGGLNSLIEKSLGITKSRKGEMKGNPVDLIEPEQTDNKKDDDDEVLAKPRTPKKQSLEKAGAEKTESTEAKAQEKKEEAPTVVEETDADVPMDFLDAIDDPIEDLEETTLDDSIRNDVADNSNITTPEPTTDVITETVEPQKVETKNTITANAEANTIEPGNTDTKTVTTENIETKNTATITAAPQPEESNSKSSIEQPTSQQPVEEQVISVSLEADANDDTKIAYLKEVISDLRHELYLWRNGTINVQTFNATLHTNGLKYNPENNEIEEFD